MTTSRTPPLVIFSERNNLFLSPYIAESANIAENTEIFWQKTVDDIAHPCSCFFNFSKLIGILRSFLI